MQLIKVYNEVFKITFWSTKSGKNLSNGMINVLFGGYAIIIRIISGEKVFEVELEKVYVDIHIYLVACPFCYRDQMSSSQPSSDDSIVTF